MRLSIFSCAYWPFVYLPWRCVYLDPLPSFQLSICPFLIELQEFSICSGYRSHIKYMTCKHFSICHVVVVFPLSWWYPLKHKSLKFWWSLNYLFFPLAYQTFGIKAMYSLPSLRSWRFTPMLMTRVNVDILGISELKWTNLTQMTIISTTAGRNPSEEME